MMTDVLTDETEIERLLRAGISVRQVAQQMIEPIDTVMRVLERVRREPTTCQVAAILQPLASDAPAPEYSPNIPRVTSVVTGVTTLPSDVSQALPEEPSPVMPTPPGFPEGGNLPPSERLSPAVCERDGCTEPATRKALCRRHYDRRRDADRAGKRSREDTIIRTRARNRAVAQLVQAHKDEFDRLMEEAREQVMREMYELRTEAAKRGVKAENGIVRLKTGPRPADESIGDRIREDVGSCPHCHSHHDGGHLCRECGAELTGEGELASAVGDGTVPQTSAATEKWKRDGAERARRLMEARKKQLLRSVR